MRYIHGMRNTLIVRFWAKVIKTDSCWLWDGAKARGYGIIRRGPASESYILAHVLSWIIHHGEIPEGLWVLHNCPNGDRRDCVNPAHLWLGTDDQNKADARMKRGNAHKDGYGRMKLTSDDITSIRNQYIAGEHQAELAVWFEVSQTTISRIVSDLTHFRRSSTP